MFLLCLLFLLCSLLLTDLLAVLLLETDLFGKVRVNGPDALTKSIEMYVSLAGLTAVLHLRVLDYTTLDKHGLVVIGKLVAEHVGTPL